MDFFSGSLSMTTFKKLPMAAPAQENMIPRNHAIVNHYKQSSGSLLQPVEIAASAHKDDCTGVELSRLWPVCI